VAVPQPGSGRFVPRATLVLAGGVALFFVLSMLYSLPVLMEPVPDGAPENYLEERVREHMQGKVPFFFAASVLAVAVVAGRPWKR
jgi:hypothetical protein